MSSAADPKRDSGYDIESFRLALRACTSETEVVDVIDRFKVFAGSLEARSQFWRVAAAEAPYVPASMIRRFVVVEGVAGAMAENPAVTEDVRRKAVKALLGMGREDPASTTQLVALARAGWIQRGDLDYRTLENRLGISVEVAVDAVRILNAVPGSGPADLRNWMSSADGMGHGRQVREAVAREIKDAEPDFYLELLRGPWTDGLFESLAEVPAARTHPEIRSALLLYGHFQGGVVLRRMALEASPGEMKDLLHDARQSGGLEEVVRVIESAPPTALPGVPLETWTALLASTNAQVRLSAIRLGASYFAAAAEAGRDEAVAGRGEDEPTPAPPKIV